MRRFSVRLAAGVLAAAALPHALHAQGYGVYEQGACTMGRAGAAVASTCNDGSAIFFNPAGIVSSDDSSGGTTRISVGGTLVAPRGNFTDRFTGQVSNLQDKVIPVPSVYLTRQIGDKFAAGIGLFAPYGLTIDWDPTSQGRFLGYHSKIAAIYLQPTVGTKLLQDRLSLGAGFDVSFVSVGLRQRVDLSTQQVAPGVTFGMLGVPTGTDFADVDVTGSGTGVGYHVGAQLKVNRYLSVGARYLSRQLVKINDGTAEISQIPTGLTTAAAIPTAGGGSIPAGTPYDVLVASQFADGGALTTQAGSTWLRLPNQLVLGVALNPTDRAKLLFDYQYTYWGVFNVLQLNFERLGTRTQREAYRGTRTFRVGGEYALTPTSAVRLGWYTHGAAAPAETVTPLLPEGQRSSFTAGIGTNLGRALHVDVSYQYIAQADRQGRTGDGGSATPTATANNGLYQFHAHLIGATLGYAF